tara:strand:- start:2955 stop:3257 length:303 start_codon:yes stop_codon:yes gene_type:complete
VRKKLNKTVVCADGFSMSVQANGTAYCHPRQEHAEQYTEVEIGFPSEEEELLMEWAENPSEPTDTVYAWVPAGRVSLVIAKHGGMVSGELPPGIPRLEAC